MAQPSWVTGSGSLGTIPEGKFYRASLEAFDPDFPSDSSKVKYIKVSGALPQGIQINTNGIIEGTPVAFVQGVPLPVSQNVTSKFSIRVYTENIINGSVVIDSLSDRTFTLTVTGQDAPEFITSAGQLGKFFDGQLVNIQVEFTDSDPSDTAVVSIVSGGLPPGITISETGLIYGHIEPVQNIGDAISGWENEGWDAFPLQFNTASISKNYQFTLRITDGVDFNLRTFSIYVGIATADSTAQTVDLDTITADTATQSPFITQYVPDLGTFLHDNYFVHEFKGKDFNNDVLNYSLYSGSLPSGLSLDLNTGILYGVLSDIGLTEVEYNFSIKVYRKENPIISSVFSFKITIIGDIDTGVDWVTNANLGTINNGDTSLLNISASVNSGTELKYRLKQGGVYNKLPQGLSILESGNIVGVVSYQIFGIYDYKTTADDSKVTTDTSLVKTDTSGNDFITFDNDLTTFNRKFVFTVETYTLDGTISSFKTFNISVIRKFNTPLHSIQINALMPKKSKTLLDSLLTDTTIINPTLLYRPDDPRFGIATEVSYNHAYGLSPELISSYVESMELNHYRKQLVLGSISTARALNDNGDIIYEVVYSNVIDDLVNSDNRSVSKEVPSSVGNVYPNSLNNMRNRVIDKVGQLSHELPRWMLSKQKNGNILGFIPAWVIAYTLPGQSESILYNINKDFGIQLNKIDFSVDRYTLESQFTSNWNAEDQRWNVHDSTTFDIYNHGTSASITSVTSDTSSVTTDLVIPDAVETTFDKGSCVFIGARSNTTDITIKTVDTTNITADNGLKDSKLTYQVTDKFNKYLKFPNKDIINKE